MDNTQSLDFSEYVAAFKRRRKLIGAVALPALLIALALALGLPNVYRSTALIGFAEAEVSGELQDSQNDHPATYEEEYVSSLKDAVLSKDTLRPILDKVQIAPNQAEEPGDALELIAENTEVSTVRTEILDPSSGREREIITGFTVSYNSHDPKLAKQVASWLSTAVVEASRSLLSQRAVAAAKFYADEADGFRTTITGLESKLADFKQKNYGRLPELTNSNMNALDRIERDLDNNQMEIRSLNQNRIYLVQKLEEARAGAPSDSLIKQLEAEYSQKSAIYDENHPDLVTLRRQIENARAGGSGANMTLPQQLASQRAILASARQRYSDDHPDVKRVLRNIESLEARIARGEKADSGAASNPVVSQLQTQLAAMDTQVASLQANSIELRAKMTEFEGRVETTPMVEREYQNLTRDLDLARKKYDELVNNRIDADLKASAIKSGRSDELKLVRPPALPGSAAKPKRIGILVIGLVLGLAIGFTAAVIAETLDPSVRGSRDIALAFAVMPLAAIPNIQDALAKRRSVRRAFAYVGSLAVATVLLIVVIRVSA